MLKKCKVVMLLTNKKASIIQASDSLNLYLTSRRKDLVSRVKPGIATFNHLYILSDDEIKVGDYFIDLQQNCSSRQLNMPWLCEDDHHEKSISFINSEGLTTFKKVIATSDKSLNLPSPSKSFIKKYCDLNGKIDEVNVEYSKRVNALSNTRIAEIYATGKANKSSFKFNDSDWNEIFNEEYLNKLTSLNSKSEFRLNISSDNTITIKPIKNNFTREEVVNIMIKSKCTQDQITYFIENF